jgi:hypothetical protein
VEHQLAVVLLNERSDQRCVAGAQGLHFVPDQDNPGLVRLENRVVMPGSLIRGDGPAACFPGRGNRASSSIPSVCSAAQGTSYLTDMGTVPGERSGRCLAMETAARRVGLSERLAPRPRHR